MKTIKLPMTPEQSEVVRTKMANAYLKDVARTIQRGSREMRKKVNKMKVGQTRVFSFKTKPTVIRFTIRKTAD